MGKKNSLNKIAVLLIVLFSVAAFLIYIYIPPSKSNVGDSSSSGRLNNPDPETISGLGGLAVPEVKQKESFGSFYDVFDAEEPYIIGSFSLTAAEDDLSYKIAVQVIPIGSVLILDERGEEVDIESPQYLKKSQEKKYYPVFNGSQTIPYVVQIEIYDEMGELVDVIQFERGD